MSSQLSSRSRIVLFGGLLALIGWLAVGGNQSGIAGQRPVTRGQPSIAPEQGEDKERTADKLGIEKAIEAFETAFKNGDGKAVAALWTVEGEYTSEDGTTFTGRAALEKSYSEFFSRNLENALDVEIGSIKFRSRDTAVVEGLFKLHQGKKQELTVSKCSFLFTREDGKWLIAIAREWPGDGMSIRDLEWLIGTWEAKRDSTVVNTKYEWTKNKTFIRCQVSITQDGRTVTANQMIGKVPSTGGLHIWTFEDEGGIGDADITRDGKKWIFATHASTADGRVITATNIMTPVNGESFLWQTVERTLDDEDLPDLAPVKVVRVKPTK